MYSELQVIQSNAGYFIGRYWVEDDGFDYGTRESDYYPTKEAAEAALQERFVTRRCQENFFAWHDGYIDTQPGVEYRVEDGKTMVCRYTSKALLEALRSKNAVEE